MDIAFEPEFEIATETVSHDFKMVGDCSELFAAVAKAQSNFRSLAETKEANVKTYTYTYADLAAVLDCVRPCLNAQGISVMQSATMGRVQTILGHSSGAALIFITEFANSDLPPQQQGSLFTFYKRYALNAAVAVASGGEDIDASDTLADGKVAEIVNLPTRPKPHEVIDWGREIPKIRKELDDFRSNKLPGIDQWVMSMQGTLAAFAEADPMDHASLIQEINAVKKELKSNG